ncbi:MAG: LPP20 family lipoprotein, partial [Thermodesulfobacteriota bacterium]
MAFIKSIITLILLTSTAYAQSPEWVKNFGISSKYPANLYLTGFGLAQMGKNQDLSECRQLATDDAKSVLIQSIRVKIRSEVTSNVKEINTKVSEYFSSVTQSTSSIEITGLEIEYYISKDACYSLAFVNKEKLTSIYSEKASVLRETIRGHLRNAKRYKDA